MRDSLHGHLKMEGGFTKANLKGLDAKGRGSVLRPNGDSASPTRSQISLPSTPGIGSTFQSRGASTERSSEIAPEIVVWTEDMDFDEMSQDEPDDSSLMDMDDE